MKVINKLNKFEHLLQKDTPRCCLDQLGLKSAGFGLMPEIWRESLHVSERPLKKRLRKRASPRNAQKSHKNHTQIQTHHFCHSHLSFLPSLSLCGLQIDKKTSILKPRGKQLIIYAILPTKIHFAARELCTDTHTHAKVSHCQKTVEVGGFS